MFFGALNIICNVCFIFDIGSFSTIGWYDKAGNYRTLTLDSGSLLTLAVIKIIIGGILLFK